MAIKYQKEKKKELITDPNPYISKFVNASRPLPLKNSPIPSDWEPATFVKQISTYSRKFLRDINDPKQKNKQLLVGKSVYIENNRTFDDAPIIL